MVTDVRPDTLDEFPALRDAGVTSIKLFTAYPGTNYSDDGRILQAMQRAADLDLMVMMHAENGIAIDVLRADAVARGDTDPIHHLLTRPASLEAEAVERMVRLAEIAGCRLTIVHISSADALQAAVAGRDRGVPVFAETCPQYLASGSRTSPTGSTRPGSSAPLRCGGGAKGTRRRSGTRSPRAGSTPSRPITAPSPGQRRKRGATTSPGSRTASARSNTASTSSTRAWSTAGSPGAVGRGLRDRPARLAGLHPRKGVLAPGSDADVVIYDPHTRHRLSRPPITCASTTHPSRASR
jgi:dihydropyrimidinase